MAKSNKSSKRAKQPEEQIQLVAESLINVVEKLKTLEKEKEHLKGQLSDWYTKHGEKAFSNKLTVSERLNPPALSGATGKRLEMLINKLTVELPPAYVKRDPKLDLGLISESIDADPVVRALLNEAGLTVIRSVSLVFKAVKD